jgi:phospholipase C
MGYYTGDDLNYYYYMATQFATSDAWFSPVMTRTEPNREFLIGATSGGYAYPQGTNQNDSHQITSPMIFELLQNAGISWKIYVDPRGSVCENNQTADCFYKYLTYIHTFTYGQTILQQYPQNIQPISQYYLDLQNNNLPQVAQIEPASAAGLDEHPADYDTDPPCCSIQAGAANTEQIINALMASPYWKDSAFILTFDEFGGFYDHVAPAAMPSPDGTSNLPVDLLPGDVCTKESGVVCDFNHTGYRVPLIVVSPYTKKNYVSHTTADLTAILKLIETRFKLASLTKRDAAQMDMTEFFDFNNPVWMTPPNPPKQNRSGPCYLNQLP